MVVVFPAPFGPRKPKHSPGPISKSTPSTATNEPNRFASLRARTTGSLTGQRLMVGESTRSALAALGDLLPMPVDLDHDLDLIQAAGDGGRSMSRPPRSRARV